MLLIQKLLIYATIYISIMQVKTFEEYQQVYRKSVEQPEEFWAGISR